MTCKGSDWCGRHKGQALLWVSALFAVCAFGPQGRAAEDDLARRISEVSVAVAKDPTNADLYITRADMHRRRLDMEAALGDLDYAAGIPTARIRATLLAAELLFELRRYAQVVSKTDGALATDPQNAQLHILRARALVAQSRFPEAAAAYKRALALSASSEPDVYLECARALAAQGRAGLDDALLVLDEGVAKLGPIVSLQIPAIAFELQAKHWDAALLRVDSIAAKSPRKDLWLKRRGEILRQAGRKRQARDAFKAALAALRAWPPDVQSQPANKALAAEIEGAVRLLGK